MFDLVSAGKTENRRIVNKKIVKVRLEHMKQNTTAAVILTLGKQPSELTVSQLNILQGALKHPDERAIPTHNKEMLQILEELEDEIRRGGLAEEDAIIMVEDNVVTLMRTEAVVLSGNDDNEVAEGN